MSEKTHIQYIGFQPRIKLREYAFRLMPASRDEGEPVELTLTISNDAFLGHRARYQDGPDICFLKLQRELGDDPHRSLKLPILVSEEDLTSYREAHAPKSTRR